MEDVFLILSLLAFVAFIVGMFNPKTVKCSTRGKVALIYVSAFIVFLFISAALTPLVERIDTQEETQSEEVLTEQSEAEEVSEQDEESAIGQTISVGDFAYTVKKFSFKKGVGRRLSVFGRKKADGVYLVIHLRITNIGNKTKTLNSGLFSVSNDDIMYKPSNEAEVLSTLNGKETMEFAKQCHPGITTEGMLVFEVPCKDEYYLHLPGGDMMDDIGTIVSTKILLK